MRYSYIFSTFVMYFVLLSSGCFKERPIPQFELDPLPMEYTCFNEGTHWEYVDTATGERKFVEVIQDTVYYFELEEYTGEVIRRMETFEWTTNEKISYKAQQINDSTSPKVTFKVEKSPNWYTESRTIVFFYPFNDDLSTSAHGSHTVSIHEKYDTLQVLGKKFSNVIAFKDNVNFTEGGVKTITYVAKNFGIIRTDIRIPRELQNDGSVRPAYWKKYLLIKFNIVQE